MTIHNDSQMARALDRERGTYCLCRECAYQFVLDVMVCVELYEGEHFSKKAIMLAVNDVGTRLDPIGR